MRVVAGLLLLLLTCGASRPGGGRVVKVLPHLLDEQGRHSLSPSLYERDAYQAELRKNPGRVSGVRYDIRWRGPIRAKAPLALRLRVELRTALRPFHEPWILETTVHERLKGGAHWTGLTLAGEDFKKSGPIIAWRAVLLQGDQVLDEQRSFLW